MNSRVKSENLTFKKGIKNHIKKLVKPLLSYYFL